MKLRIGSNLTLPAEAATQTFAILGKRGVGKTNTAVVMAEELLKAQQPVVIVDPVGVWWGLRSSADGKQEGFPIVVLGGEHADAPLEVTGGDLVADMVVSEGLSIVLDLSLFRKNDMVRFMTDFSESLYRKNRKALHVILDEADAFAPQKPFAGQERLLGAIEDIVRRGRARGLGVTMITQRPAVLNKNVLTQIEVLVTLRLTAPHDHDAIKAWVESHGTPAEQKQLLESLPSLPIGTAWFWSPGWLDVFTRVAVRARETFDSSATPKVGAAKVQPKRLAAVDLEKLKTRMAETIERAKADDPKELRKRIAELERQVQSTSAVIDPAVIERAKEDARQELYATVRNLRSKIAASLEVASGALTAATNMVTVGWSDPVAPLPPQATRTGTLLAVKPKTPALTNGNHAISGGLRRILTALAQRPQGLSARQIGVRAGLSSSSGTFGTYLSRARTEAWVTGTRDRLQITDAGRKALGHYDDLPTGRALLDFWLGELGGGAGRMLEALAAAYPRSLTKQQLGEAAGLAANSGTFGTYLSKLRTLELIEGSSELKASEELFQ